MGQNQGAIAKFKAQTDPPQKPLCQNKQQHEGYADDNFRIDNRQIGDIHNQGFFPFFHTANSHSRRCTDHRCDDRGNQRDNQGIEQRLKNQIVVEQLDIPIQRKPGKIRPAFGLVKGKENQNADRRV